MKSTTRRQQNFDQHIGRDSSKLGCVNAFHRAGVFDATGKHLGYCPSVPNCILAAFHFFPTADFVQTRIPLFATEFVYRRDKTKIAIAAAALNAPVVALLNSVNPALKKPFNAKVRRAAAVTA